MTTRTNKGISEDTLITTSDGSTVTIAEYIAKAAEKQKPPRRIVNIDAMPQQNAQWDFLMRTWPALSIFSMLSGIICLILQGYVKSGDVQIYVLAIIEWIVFVYSFIVFFAGAIRYVTLLILLIFMGIGGLLLTTFYFVALMEDFFRCSSSLCSDWRLYLYDFNWLFLALIIGLLVIIVRTCWIILMQQRNLNINQLNAQAANVKPRTEKKDE